MSPVKRRYQYFLRGVKQNVIVLTRSWDGREYHKTVPQTDYEMLGMGVREDFTGAHCYIYENGREVDKDKFKWRIPNHCLFRATASQEQPLVLKLPESTSTFSIGTIASDSVEIGIDRDNGRITITPDKETPLAFTAFRGEDRRWEPISTASYVASSSGSQDV